VPVCRLSGLRASGECAALDEWFAPGTAPTRDDDWERGGQVALPEEYAEWARDGLRTAAGVVTTRVATVPLPLSSPVPDAPARFHIVSPLDGDRYGIPTGVEARYATIALRASGPGADRVEWTVDGARYDGARWALVPGAHAIEAVSARGERVQVRIVVDR
jgi:hypothetical protein